MASGRGGPAGGFLGTTFKGGINLQMPLPNHGYAQVLNYAEVLVTSAQLKALVETPITLIAAPPAGCFIELVSVLLLYNYGTATYTAGHAGAGLYYGSATGSEISDIHDSGAGILFKTASAIADATASPTLMVFPAAGVLATTVVAQPIVLASVTTDYATGDGTLLIKLVYRIHTTSTSY